MVANAQSTQDAGRNFQCKSFDVACVQYGHPHSHQQVPFACVALRIESCILCGLGLNIQCLDIFLVYAGYVHIPSAGVSGFQTCGHTVEFSML